MNAILRISTLCFLVIINSIPFAYSIHKCSANTEGNDVMSIEPYYVREMGGEQLIIDLPCQNKEIDDTSVKCRFESYPEKIVDGEKLGYNQIACVTPAHIYLGIQQVYVSVDNGSSFDYAGTFYAESEALLEPHLVIENFDSAILQDFTTDMEITLSWDKSIIASQFLTLNLMMIIDPLSELKSWDESTVLIEKVENNGRISFKLSDVVQKKIRDGFDRVPITAGTYQLTDPNSNKYIAGPITVFSFANISFEICKLYNPLLEKIPKGLIPCPCNTTQANNDNNYTVEPDSPLQEFFHPGVATCYRSVPSEYGSSEQCCYNSDGKINVGTDGSGTSDTFSPQVSTLKHVIYDVLPWFACCKVAQRCDYYSKYRPSDDCSDYQPTI